MMFSQAACLLALSSLVAAVPLEKRWGGSGSGGNYWWTPKASSGSYLGFGKRFPGVDSNAPTCDLSQATMPTAPTPLPDPSSGLSLSHVAIGRGTQNYTCDSTNATATPVAIGALATLFNVSCIAADQPILLNELPGIALNLPVPSSSDTSSPMYQDVSGHHYFIDSTTPYFDLDTSLHSYGKGAFKKISASSAPSTAPKGQLLAFSQGTGAVPWLKLDIKDPSTGQLIQEVYRLNTAGGQPSATCDGMPAAFEVQYAAEYWFFD